MDYVSVNDFNLASYLVSQEYVVVIEFDENGRLQFKFLNTTLLKYDIENYQNNETLQNFIKSRKELNRKVQNYKKRHRNKLLQEEKV